MLDAETVVSSGTMKITCSREELTQKLAVVSRGVSTRTAVQILGGILLNAEGGRLTLAATDMELSLRASLEARVEGEGSCELGNSGLPHGSRRAQAAEPGSFRRERPAALPRGPAWSSAARRHALRG